MNSELYGEGPERMGHRMLDRLRELVAAQRSYVQLLEKARSLVDAPVLDCSLSSQAKLRRSYCEDLDAHLPRESGGNGRTPSSSADGPGDLVEAAEHLRLTARTKLASDERAAVRAELLRHDAHLLERYRQLSEQVREPNLLALLKRQHEAIQDWAQRLESKTHA